MDEVLFVNACIRPQSRTLRLARHVLEGLGGRTEEVDLSLGQVLPLSAEEAERRERLVKAGALDDPLLAYARQFARADQILIAAPC